MSQEQPDSSPPTSKVKADDPSSLDGLVLDPTFVNARREAIVILSLLFVFACWSLTVSIVLGYDWGDQPIKSSQILGMPVWVFFGILVPWVAVDLIAIWFCFFFMKDDDLGIAPEDREHESDPSQSVRPGENRPGDSMSAGEEKHRVE